MSSSEDINVDVTRMFNVIAVFTKAFVEAPDRWTTERMAHYHFYEAMFDEFPPERMRDGFRWEYPCGVPAYGISNKEGAIDMVLILSNGGLITIEIEMVGPGKGLEVELDHCISKFQTPQISERLEKGFIIPLLHRKGSDRAKGYPGKTIRDLVVDAIMEARGRISGQPLRIVDDGIIFD